MPLYVFQTVYQPRKLPKKKGKEEELAKMDQGMRPRPIMAHLASRKPKFLAPGFSEDSKQKKVIEELSWEENKGEAGVAGVIKIDEGVEASVGDVPLLRKGKTGAFSQPKKKAVEVVDNYAVCNPPPLQRTLSVTAAREVVLDIPPKVPQSSRGSDGGSYDSKRKLKELIGPPGARIPDDAVRNLPFYLAMGARAFKKYFNPRWEDLASHGDFEDVLEASLAATLQADFKESDTNVLHLTKKLDDANAAQKVTAEALKAANEEKKRLLEELSLHRAEAEGLRGSLEASEKGRKDAEAEIVRLLDQQKEMKKKMESVEANYVANFHNTEAYTNFSDYFAKVGHQEVLAALRSEHPDFSISSLEVKFLPPHDGDDC
ncbi:hypothetical protein Adt_01207 [Abeliophyllum distichum]|uniref:Uncharacterized protein n=1 Tax=Abeliophyllum distichum TaxID=126358 RepID=A0ABD1VS96_9LAMI